MRAVRSAWCVGGVLLILLALSPDAYSLDTTVGGVPRNQAFYLTMRDGVRIAVDLWLPPDLTADRKIPAMLKMTSYWRAVGLANDTATYKVLSLVNAVPTEDMNRAEADAFAKFGYAVVYVDARGTGASFGTREHPFATAELDDYDEVVNWIVAQPWSNGCVGAMGVSYEGTAAELLSTRMNPAVRAVAPLFSDFDPWAHIIAPGGVLNEWFIAYWRDGTRMLDTNDLVALAKFKGQDYNILKRVITGVKRVDDDKDGKILLAALDERSGNVDVFSAARALEYRDESFGTSGDPVERFSPCGMQSEIEQAGLPMYVCVGWMDAATVCGALSRYLTFSNPQKLVIGPWGHAGKHDANPFRPADTPVQPTKDEAFAQRMDFFGRHAEGGQTTREIVYYTMGEDKWKSTDIWPPANVTTQSYYFLPDGGLDTTSPPQPGGDEYTVDFDASTGESNRWRTQADANDVIYPDRASEDKRLLTYTTSPLTIDVEVTGSPVVTLYISSTETDGAFYAYLEAVSPEGKVVYLTEGMLRAVHRKVSDEPAAYAKLGPHHSFKRSDAMPLAAGEIAAIEFDLIPTSVRILAGWRIRVAIAGHDKSCFARYPAIGQPKITVHSGAEHPSGIRLPVAQ